MDGKCEPELCTSKTPLRFDAAAAAAAMYESFHFIVATSPCVWSTHRSSGSHETRGVRLKKFKRESLFQNGQVSTRSNKSKTVVTLCTIDEVVK